MGRIFSKKGTFSCLLILFWYNFCYVISWVGFVNENSNEKFDKEYGMAFSLIFGIISLVFSIVFKDIMFCFMNILIHIGMAKYYFEKVPNRSSKDFNENGDGAIDMIILICSIIWFINLIIEISKKEILKLKQQILGIGQVQTQAIVKVNANSEKINLLSSSMNLPTKSGEITEKNYFVSKIFFNF